MSTVRVEATKSEPAGDRPAGSDLLGAAQLIESASCGADSGGRAAGAAPKNSGDRAESIQAAARASRVGAEVGNFTLGLLAGVVKSFGRPNRVICDVSPGGLNAG